MSVFAFGCPHHGNCVASFPSDMVLGFHRACRGRQIEAEDLYGLGLAVLERRKPERLSLQSGKSSEQLKGPELIAPSLSLCCVPGWGGGARVGQNFTQGPNSSAIFRSCKTGHHGAWAAAFLFLLLVGASRRPSSCCRAWPPVRETRPLKHLPCRHILHMGLAPALKKASF